MRWSTFEGLRLLTLPGVFLPTRSDTALLWRTVQDLGLPVDGRVLEVCTGSGALALSAARCGGTVTAVDLTRRAVATVRANAALHRLRVDVRRGDLLAPVRGERFDLVLSNPPYLPVPPGGDRSAASLAWDGGTGR
jgi:release factor glutamine methyltransferase